MEVFSVSYANILTPEKLVWTKSKDPCTSVKIDFDFVSKVFKSELLSNFAVMDIFPHGPMEIFIDCILHVLINLDKFSTK